MANEYLKKNIIEVLNNQLRDNDPECAKETYDRLISLGYSSEQAKNMIGAVLTEEIYEVLKKQEAYNQERYAEKLSLLPGYFNKNGGNEDSDSIGELINRSIVNDNKIGRNDPCPCGSGKKYKKCCGK